MRCTSVSPELVAPAEYCVHGRCQTNVCGMNVPEKPQGYQCAHTEAGVTSRCSLQGGHGRYLSGALCLDLERPVLFHNL